MAAATQGLYCVTCDRQTLHVDSSAVNHVLHFLLGLLTCSLWWIVWLLLVAAKTPRWACGTCGTQYDNQTAIATWQARGK